MSFSMDRKFDFRVLLVQIQNRLSDDDRRRLHFLIGDIIPRHQRDDCTLRGTLTLLESLFDRALISEDYLDFLVRIFREIECYDAVRQLQDYQSIRTPIKQTRPSFSDVLLDNHEEDKIATQVSNEIRPGERNSDCTKKIVLQQLSSIEPSVETATPTDQSCASARPTTSRLYKIFTAPLTVCLFILLIFELLALSIYLIIHFNRHPSTHLSNQTFQRDAYIVKHGKSPFSNLSGQWFDHAENLSLTFADRLISIDAYSYEDELYSLEFHYLNNKTISHQLKNVTRLHRPVPSRLTFTDQNVAEITQCFEKENQVKSLVGLRFRFQSKATPLLGSCNGRIQEADVYPNTILGYAVGKTNTFLQGFQFVWYEICPLRSEVASCVDKDVYVLESKKFYGN